MTATAGDVSNPTPAFASTDGKGMVSRPGCLLTAGDLAARWQLEPSQVYRLTRAGLLPTVRLGRYYRYALEQVEAFERAGGTQCE